MTRNTYNTSSINSIMEETTYYTIWNKVGRHIDAFHGKCPKEVFYKIARLLETKECKYGYVFNEDRATDRDYVECGELFSIDFRKPIGNLLEGREITKSTLSINGCNKIALTPNQSYYLFKIIRRRINYLKNIERGELVDKINTKLAIGEFD